MSGYVPITPKVRITYPDVPADLVSKFNDLQSVINTTSSHLNNSSNRVQTFMGQANGAVQHVAGISQGKATSALVETWFYSLSDGNQSHTGMSNTAAHLSTTTTAFDEHLQAVKDGMAAIETVKQGGGYVTTASANDIQQQINNLTNALNNIGLALDGAAKLINALNSNWPMACATGFTPGSTYPAFAPTAFNNSIMHMSGNPGAELNSAAGQRIVTQLGQDQAEILIELLGNNADLNEVATLLEKGVDANQIVQWIENGKSVTGAGRILNQGIPASQVSQWVDQGLNLNGIGVLLNKGITADAINAGLSRADAQGWTGISKNIRKNMADTIKNWANGTPRFANDGTTFANRENLPALKNGPFTEYTIDNTNTGRLNELRIIVDRYGNMWYSDGHYQTSGKVLQVPWSFIVQSSGQ